MIRNGELVLVRWPELGLELVRPIRDEAIAKRGWESSGSTFCQDGDRVGYTAGLVDLVRAGDWMHLYLVHTPSDAVLAEVEFAFELDGADEPWCGLVAHRAGDGGGVPIEEDWRRCLLWALTDWLGLIYGVDTDRFLSSASDLPVESSVHGEAEGDDLDRVKCPGEALVDIELYQLMDERPPVIWPHREFVQFLKHV